MSALRTSWFESIADVPVAAWNRLASQGNPFQSSAWYQGAAPEQRVMAALAIDEGGPAGMLIYTLLDKPTHYYNTPSEVFCGFREVSLLRESGVVDMATIARAVHAPWFPTATSVAPFGYRGGALLRSTLANPRQVCEALIEESEHRLRQHGVRVIAHHYLRQRSDAFFIDALLARGARCAVAGAHCVLDIRWPSLAAYFRSLGDRGRRLRTEDRRNRHDESVRWVCGDSTDHSFEPDLLDAATNLFRQYALRREADLPCQLHARIAESWPGRQLLLTGTSPDGMLRSALWAPIANGVVYPKFFGQVARNDYFFITYPLLIETAIALGAHAIDYGGGSHQAKLMRGSQLEWALIALISLDDELDRALGDLLPLYDGVKRVYFARIATRYQHDHTPPIDPVFRPVTQAQCERRIL